MQTDPSFLFFVYHKETSMIFYQINLKIYHKLMMQIVKSEGKF